MVIIGCRLCCVFFLYRRKGRIHSDHSICGRFNQRWLTSIDLVFTSSSKPFSYCHLLALQSTTFHKKKKEKKILTGVSILNNEHNTTVNYFMIFLACYSINKSTPKSVNICVCFLLIFQQTLFSFLEMFSCILFISYFRPLVFSASPSFPLFKSIKHI